METSIFDSKDYQRARSAYRWACAFEYFVALLVADAFLAKLLTALGMSDAMIGIISSFITLAFLFQLFSIFVVQRIVNTKRFVILFHTASQLFFMSLYLIPFLPGSKEFRYVLVDEYQDTNHLQYLLTSLLAGGYENLCVVGDDDQGMYRFRGATIRNILEFPDKFETDECKVIHLDINYRSENA